MATITVPSDGDPIEGSWGAAVAEAINGTHYDSRFAMFALAAGMPGVVTADTSTNLVAVSDNKAGLALVPIHVPAPLKLASIIIRNTDSTNTRSCAMRLYRSIGTGVLQYVTGSAATLSFTASGASDRTAGVTTSGTLLIPGIYWLAIRNTSTTQTFGLARLANSHVSNTLSWVDNTPNALSFGNTLDTSALSLSGAGGVFLARLNGEGYF